MSSNFRKRVPLATAALLLGTTVGLSAFGQADTAGNAPASAATAVQEAPKTDQDAPFIYPAADPKEAITRIVALGDSVAAGYEPGMTIKSVPYAYVERLYEQALFHGRANMVNYGIINLKSDGMKLFLRTIKEGGNVTGEQLDPLKLDPRIDDIAAKTEQARADIAAASIVTLTIGGNDLKPLADGLKKLSEDELEKLMQDTMANLKDNITAVVQDVAELNAKATIVISDQYQPMPEFADRDLYPKLMKAVYAYSAALDEVAKTMNEQGVQVKIAHVAKRFEGREGELTHIIEKDMHPKQGGFEIIAQQFANVIWGEYLKPKQAYPAVPISIVVNGKELITPYKPVSVKDRTYVAIKDIVDATGATSKWDNKTQSATITYGGREVVLTVGSATMTVNKESVQLEAAPFLHKVGKEQKTYVPLAVIAKGLGFDLQYREKLHTAFINK